MNYNVLSELAERDNGVVSSVAGSIKKLYKIVKINNDVKSKFKLGDIIVGQEKNEKGEIISEGEKVDNIVILKVYFKYKYIGNNVICQSPIFSSYSEEVYGNYFKNRCTKSTCPYRNTKECKANMVVFVLATTVNGHRYKGVMYIHGNSYIPFSDYLSSIEYMTGEDGVSYRVPFYSYVVDVESRLVTSGVKSYYIYSFKTRKMLDIETIKKLSDLSREINESVNIINENIKDFSNKNDKIIDNEANNRKMIGNNVVENKMNNDFIKNDDKIDIDDFSTLFQ